MRSDKLSDFNNHGVNDNLRKELVGYFVTSMKPKQTMQKESFAFAVHNYNHWHHRSLHDRNPANVNETNKAVVREGKYVDTSKLKPKIKKEGEAQKPQKRHKFKIGNNV